MLFTQDIRKRLEVIKNALFSICRERERETERQRETERDRERQRETERDIERQRETERERQREREKERERESKRSFVRKNLVDEKVADYHGYSRCHLQCITFFILFIFY